MADNKIWRVHLFTNKDNLPIENEKIRMYCIDPEHKHDIVGLGWAYADNLEEYENKAKAEYKEKYTSYAIDNIINNIKCDNLVWTRNKNQYYIGKVIDDEAHIFSERFNKNDRNELEHEIATEIRKLLNSENIKQKDKDEIENIIRKRAKIPTVYETIGIHRQIEKWYLCEDYEVPGKVINNFIAGKTVNSVDDSLLKYCEFLYQRKVEKDKGKEISKKMSFKDDGEKYKTLKNLLHYEDTEDLLGIWLQTVREYIVFPSTNKQGTKDYEYILKKKDGHKKAIIQCKTGNDCIDLEIFDTYKNNYDIYLFVVDGCLKRDGKKADLKNENIIEVTDCSITYPESKNYQIYKISLEYLLAWAKKHKHILTDRLKHYLDTTGY